MRRNIGALMAQTDTGQSDVNQRILDEAKSYDSETKQIQALLYRHFGYSKITDEKTLKFTNQISEYFQGL